MDSDTIVIVDTPLQHKINIQFIISVFLVVLFTWLFHEFAHWVTGWILGYNPVMTLNSTFVNSIEDPPQLHQLFITGAGPIITVGIAVFAFFILLKKRWNYVIYLILFTAFYMRLLASVMNIVNPNDEGKISSIAGIGTFTIPILVSLLLFCLVYTISKKYRLSSKFHFTSTLFVMFFSSLIILLDMFLKIKILG